LSAPAGAEILGVDFTRPIGEATAQAIRDAWLDHLVLVVRGQDLSAEDQTRFCRIFGDLGSRTRPMELRQELTTGYGSGEVMYVSNLKVDGKVIGSLSDGEMLFHIDQCFTERPAMANTLYALEVPATGGDTLFANLYMAYETLPEDLKRRIEGRKALHFYQYNAVNAQDNQFDEKARNFTHPIVRRHPVSGRRSLYVNRLMTHHIVDMDPAESREILTSLFDHLERPDFVYAHKWRPRDLLIWDNRCTAHARTYFDPAERRHLRRFTVKNDAPVVAG
jgi:taurine dioxygenase